MKRFINESLNEKMNVRMGGWATFFVAISSLRRLFPQLLVLWATSFLLRYFCSELPPSCLFCSFSATQVFFSRSQDNAFQMSSCNSAQYKNFSQDWLCLGATFRTTVTMRLATSSCNCAKQEHRSISALLCQSTSIDTDFCCTIFHEIKVSWPLEPPYP